MPEIDWDVLMPAIKRRRCVLFLGPDAYPFDASQTVEQAMWAKTTQNAAIVRKFYADDGLVLLQQPKHKLKFLESMEHFYTNTETNWSLTSLQLQKLIHIPFFAIINLTFDHLLKKNFDDAQLDCIEKHYIFRPSSSEKVIKELPLDSHKPLILNLLGSFTSSDNLVLTHKDLFLFITTLFNDKETWLKELLHEADCFLFIGVPFEKWYMQLLLQILSERTKSHEEVERYALPENKVVKMADLYTHELKIQFVEATQQTVIDELYTFCEDNKLLNKPNADIRRYKNTDLQPIYRLLLRGELKRGLESCGAWANSADAADNDLKNDLTLLMARYNIMEKQKAATTTEGYKVEYNSILFALLNLLDENDN